MTHPFTEQYIAMAKEAEEIQAMRPPSGYEMGDWYIPQLNGTVGLVSSGIQPYLGWWLPRLDQIFAITHKTPTQFMFLSVQSGPASDVQLRPLFDEFPDWHELALAIVMEGYGKVWSDGKWLSK